MDEEVSNVVPFRKPCDVLGEAKPESDGAFGEAPIAEVAADPSLQGELDRLASNLRELDDVAEPEDASVAPSEVEAGIAHSLLRPTVSVAVHFEPHEVERRDRLLRWSAEDDACVATESAFRGRFGFTCNRSRRFQLLCLLHEDDLTDGELRLLWRTGDVTFNDAGAYNSARRSVEVFGRVLVAFMGLLLTLAFVRLLRLPDPLPPPSAFGLFLLVVCCLLGLIWCANTFYIRPSQIRRRARRAQGRTAG